MRALIVWDNALFEAQAELAALPASKHTPAQSAEWRRVRWLRGCITGPGPRAAYVLLPLLAAAFAAARLAESARRRLSRPE